MTNRPFHHAPLVAFLLFISSAAFSAILNPTDLSGCWYQNSATITPPNTAARRVQIECVAKFLGSKFVSSCSDDRDVAVIEVSNFREGKPGFAGAFDGNMIAVYVNGLKVNHAARTTIFANYSIKGNSLYISRNSSGSRELLIEESFTKVPDNRCTKLIAYSDSDSSVSGSQQIAQSVSGGTGITVASPSGSGGGSGLRTIKTEPCNNGGTLLTVMAPGGFDFSNGSNTRGTVDSLFTEFPRQNCATAAVLLISYGAKSACTAYGFDARLLSGTSGTMSHCVTPSDAQYAFFASTLPGRIMNVESGRETYFNSILTPKEVAAKRVIEAKANEERISKGNAEAAKENAVKIARSQAAANLKNSVVSTSFKPTEDDMKRRIDQLIGINAQGMIRLVGFKKRDGIDAVRNGVKFYSMEWTAMLEITKDCLWKSATFEAVPPTNSLDGILYASSGFQPVKQGQRIDLNGETTFRRTENGWRE